MTRSSSRRCGLVLPSLGLVGVLLAAPPAHAQSVGAEALFNDGDRLMAEGKVAEACDAFDGSNRLEPRAGTMIRLGECREKQGRLASAWSAYRDSLTRVRDPIKRKVAETRVADLEPRLSRLTITVPPTSRVEGLEILRNGKPLDPALWNREFPTDGGDFEFAARAPGHRAWSLKVTIAIDKGVVGVDVPALEPAPVVQPGPLPPVAPAVVDAPTPGLTGRRKLAIGVAAGGVVVIGVGLGLGVSAKGLEDDAFALCPDPSSCASADRANDLIDRASTRATLANVSIGVGAAAVIGGGILWFTGKPERASQLAITPRVTSRFAGLTLGGSF